MDEMTQGALYHEWRLPAVAGVVRELLVDLVVSRLLHARSNGNKEPQPPLL